MSYRFSAMLHVPGDVREAIAFYERAFGATVGWSTPAAEDMVAQLLVHGAEFWVHPAGEAIGNPSPGELGGTAVRLMLIVDDPDAVFEQAVAAGAVVRAAMKDQDYGWRDGSVVDPMGPSVGDWEAALVGWLGAMRETGSRTCVPAWEMSRKMFSGTRERVPFRRGVGGWTGSKRMGVGELTGGKWASNMERGKGFHVSRDGAGGSAGQRDQGDEGAAF